jgi:hypothetical protein
MSIYTVKIQPENKDIFFNKLKEVYPDREVIQSIYLGDKLITCELDLETDEDLTMLKLCVEVKQIPSRIDRSEIIAKIVKGLV